MQVKNSHGRKWNMSALTQRVVRKHEQSAHALSRYENLDEVQSRQDQQSMVDILHNGSHVGGNSQRMQQPGNGASIQEIGGGIRETKLEGSIPISSRMASDRSQIDFSENSEQDPGRAFKFYWKNWVQKTIGHSKSPMEIEANRRAGILSNLAQANQVYGFLPKVSSQKQLSLLKHPKAAIINRHGSSNTSSNIILNLVIRDSLAQQHQQNNSSGVETQQPSSRSMAGIMTHRTQPSGQLSSPSASVSKPLRAIKLQPISDAVVEETGLEGRFGVSSTNLQIGGQRLSKRLLLHLAAASNPKRAPARPMASKISTELREELFGLAAKGPVFDKHFGSKQMFSDMNKLYGTFRRYREDIRGLAAQIEAEAQKLDHG